MEEICVRFAPSPTGMLHIGGARTALFNYLFAKNKKGKFILRIEDTDRERSTSEACNALIRDLKWLGINWDEGPYYQSERLETYKKHIQELIKRGEVYECFCSKEELDAKRKQKETKGEFAFKYDGKCRELRDDERKRLRETISPSYRLKVKSGKTVFEDAVRGTIETDNGEIDDFIVVRQDGMPTYNFAVVVDDYTMGINFVIRGDDHISNTPKQIMLYNAFGWRTPDFAHIPLIFGPDRKRLSKRHGAAAVGEYEAMGFLSEAVFNYLSLLGWSTSDSRQLFAREELVSEFSIDRVVRTPAVFDIAKLEWINSEKLKRLGMDEKIRMITDYTKRFGTIKTDLNGVERVKMERIVVAIGDRLKKLSDFENYAGFMFVGEIEYEGDVLDVARSTENGRSILNEAKRIIQENYDRGMADLESGMRALAKENNIKFIDVVQPLRIALTGKTVSPGLFEVIELLGKERTVKRIEKLLELLNG